MSKHIDFTRPRWGHALHGHTMRKVEAPTVGGRFFDWRDRAVRYHVLVHSEQAPFDGDVVTWRTEYGRCSGRIVSNGVDHMRTPHDLFGIVVRVTPSDREEQAVCCDNCGILMEHDPEAGPYAPDYTCLTCGAQK